MQAKGKIIWISGPAVKADGMSSAQMYETVEVGKTKSLEKLLGLLEIQPLYKFMNLLVV